jgi:thiamine pyrophosphokinase
MGHCVIFCAGGFDALARPLGQDDYIIAADGGLRHTQALGIKPDAVLGDFDSLGFVPEGAQVFPVEKDDTDAMLAVRLGLEKGFDRFVIYGGLDGPRLDHTIANLQTLCFLAQNGAQGHLVGSSHIVTALRAGQLRFSKTHRGIVSLFCLGEAACVSIRGLQYELERGELNSHFPLGVSNHFVGQEATVTVHSGTVVALWERANNF